MSQGLIPGLRGGAMSEPVRIETHPTADGRHIGMLTLDSPASLNALSLEMIQLLQAALTRWEQDPAIVCVLLQGAGEKAFCAGGDIRSFYYRKQEASESALFGYARDFFLQEYRLDHHIHRYSKPLICVADGICMGGGIGLFAGAGFRVVTEKSLFAMPEVTIGLYPDVGASWFLSRMPGRLGLWLGLTGARFNGADAIGLGMADHAMASRERVELPARLAALDWSGAADTGEQIEGLLAGLQRSLGQTLPAPVLLPHQELIDALLAGRSLQGVLARLEGTELAEPALAPGAGDLPERQPHQPRHSVAPVLAGTAPVAGRGVCRRTGPLGQLRAQRGFRGRGAGPAHRQGQITPLAGPAGGRGLAG